MVLLAEWQTEESAFGGWIEARARIARKDYLEHPNVVREGATVHSLFRENGEYVFWGELATPNDNGGVIDLLIEGPYKLATEEIGRVFFGDYGVSGFTEQEGETLGRGKRPPDTMDAAEGAGGNIAVGVHRYKVTYVSDDGETRPSARTSVTVSGGTKKVELTDIPTGPDWVTARNIYRTEAGGSDYKLAAIIANNTDTTYSDDIPDASLGPDAPDGWEANSISADIKKDLLRFEVKNGAEIFDGQRKGLIRSIPRQELYGVNFSIDNRGDTGAYTLYLEEAEDEDSAFTVTDSWVLDDSAPGQVEAVFLDPDSSTFRFSLERSGDVVNADHFRLDISDVVTLGIAKDEEYTCSDAARELASRMGVSDRGVRECGVKMLPGDFNGQNYAQIMDWLCALTGYCWGIIRQRGELVLFFRPFGRRVWHVLDPEMPRKLEMKQRYSRAVMTYERPDGTIGEVDAVADPNPLGYIRTCPEPFHLSQRASKKQAEILVQRMVDRMVMDDRFGTATLSRVYRNGIAYHPYLVRPGDQIYWPSVGLTLNVTQQGKVAPVLNVTFPEGRPEFDRFNARQDLKKARRA